MENGLPSLIQSRLAKLYWQNFDKYTIVDESYQHGPGRVGISKAASRGKVRRCIQFRSTRILLHGKKKARSCLIRGVAKSFRELQCKFMEALKPGKEKGKMSALYFRENTHVGEKRWGLYVYTYRGSGTYPCTLTTAK